MAYKEGMTQAEYDDDITAVRAEYDGYIKPSDLDDIKAQYDQQIADLNKSVTDITAERDTLKASVTDKDKEINKYKVSGMKTRIAHEAGLPYEATQFLTGDDEKAIKASAEALKKITGQHKPVAPLADPEEKPATGKDAALLKTLRKMRGE